MAKFDPNDKKHQKGNDVPGGEYLIAFKRLERRVSNKGNAYLNVLIQIIAGAAKKRTFFAMVSTTEKSYGFVSRLCTAMGSTDPFDLDDERECRQALLGRPFKANIDRTTEGEYTNYRIGRVLKPTEAEETIMANWVAEQAENDDFAGGPDDRDAPPPGDDDYGYGGGAKGVDDDIPF